MHQSCWQIWPDRGFLASPDPLTHLLHKDNPLSSSAVLEIEYIATNMADLLEKRLLRKVLDELPVVDLSPLIRNVNDIDYEVIERLMLIYSYFASAYVHAPNEEPAFHLPRGVAIDLYQLAQLVERPSILSYSSYVLSNWRRIDQGRPIMLENITVLQHFWGGKDETWFILIHVAIEACAAQVLQGIQHALNAVQHNEPQMLELALQTMAQGLDAMISVFHKMPEECDSDIYYHRVRPYIFGFTNIIYDGVEEYQEKPQSFRGQTGAQSSIIPAVVALLGIEHEQTELTRQLDIMKAYMPKPHREFITQVKSSSVRPFVKLQSGKAPSLKEAYNSCLLKLLEFRRIHLYFAKKYIQDKVSNPVGTGGTVYMHWLSKLYKETKEQLI